MLKIYRGVSTKHRTYCFLLLISIISKTASAQVSPFIQVDQFGYTLNAEKVAVLVNPIVGYNAASSYTAPPTATVRNSTTNNIVFTGPVTVWNGGATHDQSGDQGWWFDFSAFTDVGSYYIYDAVNNQRSAVFDIGANPYNNVMLAAFKMFYYNRCNMAKSAPYAQPKWTDSNNFLNALQDSHCRYISTPGDASLEKDLSGGWFDAGDYNKYVSFTHSPMHDLLYAYEENPSVFTDHFNIPESNNGVPDLLDEIKWELDWLFKMTNADGSVQNKMGSRNYSENVSSPPSANINPRYYGPTCTSASATIASVFSHASIVYGNLPAFATYAAQLQAKAASCFNYVLPLYANSQLQTNCDDGSIVAGDADVNLDQQRNMLVIAAVYLFEKTGDNAYHQFIINNYVLTTPIAENFWGVNATEVIEALLRYTKLPNADTNVKNAILNEARPGVEGDWNNFFGWNTLDLYRAYMPDWSYHWGSNMSKADYGNLSKTMVKAGLGVAATQNRKSAEQLHYFHGVNPQGIVYLSNMYQFGAEKSVNEIYHTWFNDGTIYDNALTSPNGPAPGYVSGGPNYDYSINSQTPPYGQPRQKSYLDFNTGWPINSWEITEPAIYYQASYVRLLANYALAVEDALPVTLADFYVKPLDDGKAQLFWKTTSETNNDRFEIERSVDAVDFRLIGEVKGTNADSQINHYTFTDPELSQTTAYYRLKQVDFDGKYAYSKIAAIYRSDRKGFKIAPNPVTDYLDLTLPAEALPANVTLTNVSGQVVFQKRSNASFRVPMNQLASGIYILSVSKAGEKVFHQKVFKN
ncbi:glycoside hydrolase family 9 protein [Dyadobacter arcticus]|uniref:Por secretion system C-terminal sorting domain-containing protein n=1 Tax=Dyadobacter arcticus TaxID=1078754 RepID=A0ABX0UPZ9_9BACT|nr:glycoside hydrolase family 9 protein [Dyadobacter arcticus]NIJ55027.1 hypothetical protein [Dyadobacter arcticus]